MATLAATFNPEHQTTPGHYGPSQTALLLLDFPSLFVQRIGGPEAFAALEVAAKMGTWAKPQRIQVIHALIDIHAVPFPTCKYADRLAGIVATMKSSGSEEPAELLEGGLGDDVTFTRIISALKSPGLDDFLQKKGIKSPGSYWAEHAGAKRS
jgi:nicotinamidase-related amidase